MIFGKCLFSKVLWFQSSFNRHIFCTQQKLIDKRHSSKGRSRKMPSFWEIDPKSTENEDWLDISGQYKVFPWSISGLESSILVLGPDFRVVFDMGYAFPAAVRCQHVFISHGHTDHVGAIISHASKRGLYGMPPATYYLPPHLVKPLTEAVKAFSVMNRDQIKLNLKPVQIDEHVQLPGGLFMKPFPTVHRVPSQGYILYREKKTLKPEFQGKPSMEIALLVRQKQDIFNVDIIPEIAYTGDTVSDIFHNPHNPDILRVKLLITEATYVDDEVKGGTTAVNRARKRGHMHIDEIFENDSLFSNVDNLLLVHFSDKYSTEYVKTQVAKKLPPSLKDKVHLGLVLKKKFEYNH